MRKPTLSILLPTGTESTTADAVQIALAKTELAGQFHLQLSPLRLDETAFGVDPWQVIYCPVCEKREFVTTDHATVCCDHCYTEFKIRPTAGDPGFVADASTEHTYAPHALHPALIGRALFIVVKNGEDDHEWLVKETAGGVVGLSTFLKTPNFGLHTHLIKM